MAASIVQWAVSNNGAGSTTSNVTLSANPTSGNMLYAFVSARGNPSITPSGGGGWTSLGSVVSGSDLKTEVFYATGANNSSFTTFGFSITPSNRSTVHIVELSGVSTSAPTNILTGNSGAISLNPSGDAIGDVFLGLIACENTSLGAAGGGSGTTDVPTGNTTFSSGGGSASAKLWSTGLFTVESSTGSAINISPSASVVHIGYAFTVPVAASSTPVTGSDSTNTNLTATETSSLVITNVVSTSDTGNITGTDAVVTPHPITSTRTDTGNLIMSVSESSSSAVTSSRTDTGNITGTDTSAVSVVLNRTDTGNLLASAEAGSVASAAQPVVTQDSGNLFLETENANVFSFQLFSSVSDDGLLLADDVVSSLVKTSSRTDTGNLTSTEAGLIFNPVPTRTDTGNLTSTEVSALGSIVAVNDSGSLTSTESATIFVPLTAFDDGDFSGDDVALGITPNLIRSDTGNLTATEARTIASDASRTDTGNLTSTESSTLFKSLPFSDTGTLSATETATIAVTMTRTDSGTISGVERSSDTTLTLRNVNRWNGASFNTVPLRYWDGIAFINPKAWRWNGTSFDPVP